MRVFRHVFMHACVSASEDMHVPILGCKDSLMTATETPWYRTCVCLCVSVCVCVRVCVCVSYLVLYVWSGLCQKGTPSRVPSGLSTDTIPLIIVL